MSITTKNIEVAGRAISIETGRVAEQANGAVVIRQGDSVVLSTVVMSKEPREGIDFFPLTCDYEEKLYAAGKIPGAFMRREGRPSETAILASRLTDRPLRPLFPDGFRLDIQVVSTVLSVDQENDPTILSINGASTAIVISDVPWAGPVGAVRMGLLDGQVVVNPPMSRMAESELDLSFEDVERIRVLPVDMRVRAFFAGLIAKPRHDQLLEVAEDPQRPLGAIGGRLALAGS